MKVNSKIKVSEKIYINPIFILANNFRVNIQKNLEELLGEEAGIISRNITSEIQVK